MFKYILSVLLFIFWALTGMDAQPVNNLVKDIVMPAPNAGSLGKYGDIPVSYFTGVPNIGIPIYTVQEGPLSLPVSLSYHASGVKVAETSSWVGLGWSLNAGGMITRTVQGIRDDKLYGYFNAGASVPGLGSPGFNNFLINVTNGSADGEPDIFSFNFGNYSGKFYFDKDQICQLVPRQDLKVVKSTGNFNSFTIITPDGTRYIFGETSLPATRTAVEYTVSGDEPNPGSITSWYLLRVESSDQNYAVNLYYADEAYSYRSPASCKQIQMITGCQTGQGSSPNFTQCGSSTGDDFSHPAIRTNIQGKRLTQIVSSTGIVEFVPSGADRSDLDYNYATGGTARKSLSEIKIYPYTTGAIDNNFCSKFQFYTSYYQDPNKTTTESKRLRLDSIQRKACDNTILEPAYKFSYEAGQPVYRLSKQVDHWGFYNGQTGNENNQVNTPPTTYAYNPGGGTPTLFNFGSANRETSETHLKMGVLKEINYPTGGKTTFTFEANRIKQSVAGSAVYIPAQYWLKSCNNPNDPLCCGVQQKKSQTYTFSAADGDLNLIKFDLNLTRLIATNTCNGQTPTYVAVTMTVYNNATNVVVGQTSINLSTGANSYTVTNLLKDGLVPSLQTGITYKFELSTTDGYAYFHLYTTPFSDQNVVVGGLRVKEIRNHDGISANNDVVRTYDYSDAAGSFSSGKFLYRVKYVYTVPPGIVFTDAPAAPMGGFDNSYHIGYTRIKEIFSGNAAAPQGNGYTIYQYDAYERDPNPNAVYSYPFGVPQTISDQGALLSSAQYTESGTQESISTNTSVGNNAGSTFSTGVIVKVAPAAECGSAGSWTYWWKDYIIRHNLPYRLQASSSSIDGVVTTTTYEYDGFNRHLAPTAIYFTNSDGKVQRTENKYVFDLQSGDPVRQPLIDRNIIGAPLEVLNRVGTTPTNTTIVDGTKTEYAFFDKTSGAQTAGASNSEPRPWKFYKFDMSWDANGAYIYAPGNWVEQGRIAAYHGNGSANGKGLPATFRPGNDAANWPAETYTWLNTLIKTRTYLNFTWTYDYHTNTRLVSKITNIDGQESWYDYDKLMRPTVAYARPSTAGNKSTANVKTEYFYQYKTGAANPNNVRTKTTYTPVAGSALNTVENVAYLDGLGRPLQQVAVKASPAQKDVVTAVTYDNQGRSSRTYNPFETTTSLGEYATSIPGGTPYALTEYYASPLSRVWKTTPPSWYPTTYAYGANAANEVKSDLSAGAWYAAGSLVKTTVTDPDNKTTIAWKDKKGRSILSRKSDTANSAPADTYTLYDDQDRVSQVVPPGATVNGALCFRYLYDVSDNMISKTVPDGGTTTMVYNDRDLMVLSRDPNLQALAQWRATRYDDYGRVLRSGIYNSAAAPAAPLSLTLEPSTVYLENIWDGALPIERGKVKTAKVRMFDDGLSWLQTDYTYDAHGRVSQTNGNNHLNTTLGSEVNTFSLYDWADHVINESRAHKPSPAITRTLAQTHSYDHRGRLKSNTFSVDGASAHTISELNYNWKDQLIEKNIGKAPGFTNPLQSIDFLYNDQGWLTRINQATLGGTNAAMVSCPTAPALPNPGAAGSTPDNNDLFYLELQYDQLYAGLTGTIQKNGNIAQAVWRVRGRERQSYSLGYDYLNRLSTSLYRNLNDAGTAVNNAGAYDENLTYDLRGNITTLTRTGKYKTSAAATCWTDGQIDNLAYTYTANTNRLQSIADSAPTGGAQNPQRNAGFNPGSGAGAYTYDANGNLGTDPYKGMTVAYQAFLNLPKSFTFAGNKVVSVLYDASGRKLRKTATDNGVLQYTQDYAGGIEYRSTPTKTLALESFYHAEGRVFNTNVAAATSTEILRYEYALKDHLGNTRLTFTDKNGNGVVDQTNLGSTNEVIQESHYYPFGLDLPGFWINDGGALDNQYKYNGKELNGDFGLGWMDYGARWYDASVGRWWSVDPLAEKYAGFSPYNYGVNNPVKFIDPDGKDGMIRYTEGKGTKDEPHIITIKANYYYNKNNLNSTQISALKSTINDYNSKESSSGKEKDGTYTIYKYELAEKETDSDEAALNMALGDVFVGSDGEDRQYGNVITTGEDDSALGFDLNGKRISLVNSNISKFVAAGNGDFSESDVTKSVLLHEIGHNLGGEHGDVQPMGDGHVEARYNKISPDCMGNCETKAVLTKASLNKNFARTLVDRAKNPNGRKYLEYSKQ